MEAARVDRLRVVCRAESPARLLLVLIGLVVLHATDTPTAYAEQYPIRLFDSADGLPVDGATEAIIDRDGYLWINSGGYVTRFDGVAFDLFGADRGLKGRPQALAQSGDGTIWIGTRAGLQYLEPNGDGLIHSLPKDAPLAADRVNAICAVSPTELAVAGSQSVWKVKGSPTGLSARLVYQSPESRGISTVDCDRTGTVWVSNFNDALGRISSDDSATTFLINQGALAKAPRGTALDRIGHLWVSTWDGVCIGDAAAPPGADFCRVFFRSVGSKLVSFGTGVASLSDGSIVIAANDLLRFEPQAELSAPQSVTSIGKTQGLDYGELIVGLEDRFGNVWVTDSRRGLWRVALRGSRSFDSGQISNPLIVQVLKRLRDGTMLAVGNSLEETREPHRVLQWNGKKWLVSRYPHPAGQVDTAWGVNQIVIEDADGAAWFATDDGLRGYRAGTRLDQLDAAHSDYFIGPKQNLPADQPMRVWADSRGLWWITYLNHDPYRFDPRTKQSTRLRLDSPPGEPNRKRPRAYLEDDRGLVWFAYARGIGRPRADDSWEYVPIPDLAGLGNAEDIAFDSSGALWIATGAGLFHTSDPRAASPTFTRVWPAPGVIPRIVLAIKVGKTGEIYAGTDVGVLVFDVTTRVIEQYGAGSGLPGSIVTALELGADGRMWVGTTRGIAILPTLGLLPTEVPDPLLVRVTTPLRQLPLMLAGQRSLTG